MDKIKTPMSFEKYRVKKLPSLNTSIDLGDIN